MDTHEGSFMDSRRKVLVNSSFVHSPSLVKDSARRPNRTGAILRSMQMFDDAVGNQTPMPSSLTQQEPIFGRSTLNLSKSFQTNYNEEANLSQFSSIFDGRGLLEPKTPARFSNKSTRFEAESNSCETVTNSLFNECKKALSSCQSSLDVFNIVDSLEETCTEHIELLANASTHNSAEQESIVELRSLLSSEKHTWSLVAALYRDKTAENEDDSMKVDSQESVISEKECIEQLYKNNGVVRQAQIVIDWLEQNACEDLDHLLKHSQHFTGRVCWENTLHTLKKQAGRGINGNCVAEMDPDAPTRTRKPLVDLDVEDEDRLLRCVFSCIRAGRIEQAQELCLAHGQAWRAASLEGWRLHHETNHDSGELQSLGNPHRKFWKIAAWTMSHDVAYSASERAIYGALCGNLKAMLEVCSSWEDCLWAHFKTMVDICSEQHVTQQPHLMLPWQHIPSDVMTLPDLYWAQRTDQPQQIFDKMDSSYNQSVCDEGKQPYHLVQRCLILNDVDALLRNFAECIDDVNPHFLRFIAHLILFLRSIGVPMNADDADSILANFVELLIRNDSTSHLVAMYTAFLPREQQVTSYSAFLESVREPQARGKYLTLAEEAGLDIPAITKKVVERIRSEGHADLDELPAAAPSNDNVIALESSVTSSDRRMIEAIDWLVFDQSQRCEALKQSNAVVRIFLAGQKFAAAQEVMLKIPEDSIDVIYSGWGAKADSSVPLLPEEDNIIKEHLCLKEYMSAQKAFSDWFKHFHSRPLTPQSSQSALMSASISEMVAEEHRQKRFDDNLQQWSDRLDLLCQSTSKKIYNVLLFPNQWMLDNSQQETCEEGERRAHQMSLLRGQCVPLLCDLLITTLTSTQGHGHECAKLADVIAAEEQKLYQLFTPSSGRKLLKRIQEALVEVL